ncbi:MAG TPA: RNA polymerase subunit sigma-24 [Lachnospiraceae bacterium]|nr:RNA polymerase sigma factor [Eubacterium sp.]HBZ04011.1 RNA polymerase subunit sigma-24 [Lachnospiraceae bacterium]
MRESEIIRLYDLYSDSVYRLAYSYTGSIQDSEDVVQELFLKLIQKNIFISQGKEKSYLLTMTANACKDILKSAKYKNAVPFEEAAADTAIMNSYAEEDLELFNALKKLPEDYRATIHLHYYEGYKVREIAKMLKLSSSAVTMRLTRGRNMLADLLQEELS